MKSILTKVMDSYAFTKIKTGCIHIKKGCIYLLGSEKREPYPVEGSPEEMYEFFQRTKPCQKLIEDKIARFSRSSNFCGRIKE